MSPTAPTSSAAAVIHYEPFGIYGNGVASISEVPEGATIIIPADDSNEYPRTVSSSSRRA